jgi:sporulation protein YlmC with PRC-barrel domain
MLKTVALAAAVTFAALPAMAEMSSDSFVKEQSLDQWRASKLVGVSVVGPDQKKIGSIADILVDHNGDAQTVVISVGGFLGIDEKDVAVPFNTVKWVAEGRSAATTSSTSSSALGDTASPTNVKPNPVAREASQGYPDMAMLDMTKQQLENAPTFKYTPMPAATASPPPRSDTGAMAPKTKTP